MRETIRKRVLLLLSAVMLLAVLSACGDRNEAAEPPGTSAPAQAEESADMSSPPMQTEEAETAVRGAYTATKMISGGETIDIEPMHLTVNEDGSGLMSDNNGSYNVTFYFDEGAGIIHELQSYFTFSQEGDALVLIDGRGAETVFERDE